MAIYNKFNNSTTELAKSLAIETDDIDWAEGLIMEVYMTIEDPKVYFRTTNSFRFRNNDSLIFECIGTHFLNKNYWLTLSSIKLKKFIIDNNGIKEEWWDLHIFDMSQKYEDETPALLIRAKEFNLYEVEVERNDKGEIIDRPTLVDFLKWKEEQEKQKS